MIQAETTTKIAMGSMVKGSRVKLLRKENNNMKLPELSRPMVDDVVITTSAVLWQDYRYFDDVKENLNSKRYRELDRM